MRHLPFLGFALAVLTATCSAQASPTPRVKRSHADRTNSAKSVVVGKTPPSSSQADLRRLEQQSTKVSAPPRIKRTPGTAGLLKAEKQKPAPPIRFSGNGAKGPGTTNQGTNPYKGRLRQKGAHH
jgi:hypothetical protein